MIPQPHRGRAFARRALFLAAFAIVGSALRSDASAPLSQPAITIDGLFADWDPVLASAGQVTFDGNGSALPCASSPDRDCAVAAASHDLAIVAWTYDSTNVYFYVERYANAAVSHLYFAVDTDSNGKIAGTDKVFHTLWPAGANANTTVVAYTPAAVGGDDIGCTGGACGTAPAGTVDGYKLPGNTAAAPGAACAPACTGRNNTTGGDPMAGRQVEVSIPWANVGGFNPALRWRVSAGPTNQYNGTIDHAGSPSDGVASWAFRGVTILGGASGSSASPGTRSYSNSLSNVGNVQDTYDVAARSSSGARIDLYDGATLVATDLSGDGTWDSVLPAYDSNGNGKPDFTIAPGGSKALTVTLTFPAGRTRVDLARISAVSLADPKIADDTEDVTELGAIDVSAGTAKRTIAAAGAAFPHTVTNTGGTAELVDFVATNASCGFQVELLADAAGAPGAVLATDLTGDGVWDSVAGGADANGNGRPDLSVAAGATVPFWVRVTPPGGTAAGTSCDTVVRGIGATSGSTHDATDSTRSSLAVEVAPLFNVVSGNQRLVVTGGRVYLPLVVSNAEAVARTYNLAGAVSVLPGVAGTPFAGRFFSDPDGDGNGADGAVITAVGPIGPNGGHASILLELSAKQMNGPNVNPIPAASVISFAGTATATAGGAAAAFGEQAGVSFLAPAGNLLGYDARRAYAPCETVSARAAGLVAADNTRYALLWFDKASPVVGTDVPVRTVSPWPTDTVGAALDALALPANATVGTWTLVLRDGVTTKDTQTFKVERGGVVKSLQTDRTRYRVGDPLQVFIDGGNTNTEATYYDTVSRAVVSDLAGTVVMAPDGTFGAAPGTTRQVVVPFAPAGGSGKDGFAIASAAYPATGHYQAYVEWQLACGASPLISSGTTAFDVVPPPPVITAPAAGATLATGRPTISGTGSTGASVTIAIGATNYGPVVVAAGAWSYTLTAGEALADGSYSATATQTENGVTSDPSAPVAFMLDTTPPGAPAVTAPADGLVTNTLSLNVVGNNGGDATAVNAELYDGAALLQTVALAAGGFTFTETSPPRLAAGSHAFKVATLDAVGNRSVFSNVVNVTIDRTAPGAPNITLPVADPFYTNLSVITVGGDAEANATVIVKEGATTLGSTAASGAGAWSLPITLAVGTHVVSAAAIDVAGNTGPASAPRTLVVDQTAPGVPLIATPANGATYNAASAPGGLVAVSGSAEANALITIDVDGAFAKTTSANGVGAFSTSVTVADGTRLIAARATDAAGNGSAFSAPNTFTVDATPPAAPAIASPVSGAWTNAATIQVQGTAEGNATVHLSMNGAEVATPAASALGAWQATVTLPGVDGADLFDATAEDAAGNLSPSSVQVTVNVDRTPPAAPLVAAPAPGALLATNPTTVAGNAGSTEANARIAVSLDSAAPVNATAAGDGSWSLQLATPDGVHGLAVTAADAAGNVSSPTNVSFTIDRTAPAAPVIASPADGSVLHASTVTLLGSAEAGATVEAQDGGLPTGNPVQATGTGQFTLALAGVLDGAHSFTVTARDAAGNVSLPSAAVHVTVDTGAPAKPVITSPVDGAKLTSGSLTVAGTADAGTTVHVFVNAADTVQTVAGAGGFSTALTLADGCWILTAQAVNAGGVGSAPSDPVGVCVDSVGPARPVIQTPSSGLLTRNADVTVIVSATEPGVTVFLDVDGVTGPPLTDIGAGAYQVVLTPTEGKHTLVARAVDGFGNVSADSDPVSFTIDRTPPDAPVITAPRDGALLNDYKGVQLEGTAEPYSQVDVQVDGQPGPTGVATDPDGKFSVFVDLVAEGSHALSARATDRAGNAGAYAKPVSVVVDRQPPDAPVILSPESGKIFHGTRIHVSGTVARDVAQVAFLLDGLKLDGVATLGTGAFETTLALDEGTHTFVAFASDAAGNVSRPAVVDFEIDLGEVKGGGGCHCGTGGASPLLGLFLLALLRRKRGAAVLAAALVLLPVAARAGADVERFHPASDGAGGFALEAPETLDRFQLSYGLLSSYGREPMLITDRAGNVLAAVTGRTTVNAQVAMGLGVGQLALTVPAALQQGELPRAGNLDDVQKISPVAFSDLRLDAKAPIPLDAGSFKVAGLLGGSIPTGNGGALAGADASLGVGAAGSLTLGPVTALANAGYTFRKRYWVRPNFAIGNEVRYGAGAAWRFGRLTALLEADGSTFTGAPAGQKHDTALEVLGGVRFLLPRSGVELEAAGGYGPVAGFATPAWRALLGVRFGARAGLADEAPIPTPSPSPPPPPVTPPGGVIIHHVTPAPTPPPAKPYVPAPAPPVPAPTPAPVMKPAAPAPTPTPAPIVKPKPKPRPKPAAKPKPAAPPPPDIGLPSGTSPPVPELDLPAPKKDGPK